MTISIKIVGLKECQDRLSEYSKKQIENADATVTEQAFYIEGEVKLSIAGQKSEPRSVDTGNFMSSVHTEKTGMMEAEVSTDVEYSQFLEHGTSRIPARRHFQNSATRNEEHVREKIAEALAKEEL